MYGNGKTMAILLSHWSVLRDYNCQVLNLLTMKRQWTYGPTLLPWFIHLHTSLACFTAL